VITCSRCGKENQDHYKFCLGCGNEIRSGASKGAGAGAGAAATAAAAPAAAAPPAAQAARDAVAPDNHHQQPHAPSVAEPTRSKGAAVGDPERTAVGVGSDPNAPTPPPAASSVVRPRSGIPWNDSPQLGPGGPTPTPLLTGAGLGGVGRGAVALGGHLHPARVNPAGVGALAAETSAHDLAHPPAASPAAAAAEGTVCSNCGRMVSPGFAFCGSCGARVSAAGVAGGPGVPLATGARAVHVAAPAKVIVPRGRLILIRPDGSEGGAHPLHDGENLVGRGQGILFDGDLYLSPRHAEFILGPEGLVVRDVRSLNGVFVRIGEEEALESGDIIRIGQELLRFEVISAPVPLEDGTEVAGTPNPGFWGRLSVIVGRDVDGSAFPLFGDSVVMGRERGDILFPEDGYVSGTHARISLRDGRVFINDVGSSNGTFLRVRGERKVPNGTFVLMGQQLFRLEYK
jgi:pSer/pThr/pTyr-binding forkhead associated (FHA) protein